MPAVLAVALVLSACGSEDEGGGGDASSPLEDSGATEASPEAPPAGPEGDSLSESDGEQVAAAVRAYIAAINADDGEAVCALLGPGALRGVRLPSVLSDCASSLDVSIGERGGGGTPEWRRTRLYELNAVSVAEDRARVTATVSHDFSDRPEPSVEEDVIYLDRVGDEWLIAKPSASFYRAIGYPEPPLSSLTPP